MFTNYLHNHSAIGFLSEFIWQGKVCYFSHLKRWGNWCSEGLSACVSEVHVTQVEFMVYF